MVDRENQEVKPTKVTGFERDFEGKRGLVIRGQPAVRLTRQPPSSLGPLAIEVCGPAPLQWAQSLARETLRALLAFGTSTLQV